MNNLIDKYLLISKRYSTLKRGAYCSSVFFNDVFNEYVDYIETSKIKCNYNELKYKRLIFLTQAPHVYSKKLTFINANKLNCIVFLRPDKTTGFNNTATNGFYIYKENKQFDYYIPMIYSNMKTKEKKDKLIIGIYFRNHIYKSDSTLYLKKILSELNIDFDLYVLGSSLFYVENKKMKSLKFFHDSNEFFSNVTHFIYPRENTIDPFPHTLLEAVHSNCQIVIPDIRTNTYNDGIDDIKSLIKYHTKLDFNTFYDNTKCQLTFSNLNKFYLNLFNNNFEFYFKRDKYQYIQDFLDDIM